MELANGSRVAVIGGGPAGSMVSYFLLEMAGRVDLDIQADIYEARDFSRPAPAGCNMCGGIISESLVQMLSTEGINLPSSVVHRGIDSYVLHSDVGHVRITTPLKEMRIAAVYRGKGPKGSDGSQWESFDAFLLALARNKGANLVSGRVEKLSWDEGRPSVQLKGGGPPSSYDLLIGAVGVNSPGLKLFEELGFRYQPPKTAKTFVAEVQLGIDQVNFYIGNALHVFLYDIPGLEFAALVPKGDYVTMCLLGTGIDKDMVADFASRPEVRGCFPPGWTWPNSACNCSPKINVGAARHPFTDRVVMVGDMGSSRLYKDGIGAAYRTAKACAVTAVFHGVSAQHFSRHYLPIYNRLERDNTIGKVIFFIVSFFQKIRFLRMGMLRMAQREQVRDKKYRKMSMVLWDTFTGSAPYQDVFLRAIRPAFLANLAANAASSLFRFRSRPGVGR